MVAFRRHLLLFLAIVTFQGSWLLVIWAVEGTGPTLAQTMALVCGLCLAIATYLLRTDWPTLTSWLYVWWSLGLVAFIAFAFSHEVSSALFVLPVLLAGLLLGPKLGLIVGMSASGIVLFGSPSVFGPGNAVFWLILILFACGISVIAGHALAQVDYWERALVSQQRESIHQLREHQGELNRALKAYDEACVSLERSNNELVVARQGAEEARVLKEQFAANVSHELRTPLNIIVGFIEMMYLFPESYDGVRWTPALEGDIQEVYRASRHLQSLVNDVLDLSRIDASRLPMFREMVDIRTVVDDAAETISPLLQPHGLSYSVEYAPDLPQLFVDRTRIRQVMINLLNNAVRYTDEGSISVHVELVDQSVVVSVRDTGIGIPEEQLENIFEEFTQIETGLNWRGGTGLGLAVSREFISLHGGRMWVESRVGQGSTFYFSLPTPGSVPQTSRLLRVPGRRKADLSRAPIVVVDPDPSVADMLKRYFGDRPVLHAHDIHQARGLTQREHPLALIVNLPPDAPTEEWMAHLGGPVERYDVPVFRCSIPSPSWLQQAAGFDGCLTKPVSQSMVKSVLERGVQPIVALVVDDDPGFVRLITRMLETSGIVSEVHSAYNGAHALRLAREKRPNLVLLDLLRDAARTAR